ncbi:MAG: hypothetical protein JWQ38_2523 [Flavipsychrobacter sp.]|nr:hypothetical protein [Flavipsychrobacter sp.]
MYKLSPLFLVVIIFLGIVHLHAQFMPIKRKVFSIHIDSTINFSDNDYTGQIIKNAFRNRIYNRYVISNDHKESEPFEIKNAINFFGTIFQPKVDLSQIVFNENAFFNADFNKDVDFSLSHFNKDVSFANSVFWENATFWNTHFNSCANFSGVTLKGSANFTGCIFRKPISFSYLNLDDSSTLDFGSASLPDSIDFSFVNNTKTEIDFTRCLFIDSSRIDKRTGEYRPHYINLNKSAIPNIHIDYSHFRLLFKHVKADRSNSTSYVLDTILPDDVKSIYEAVLKNFKERGQMDSYKELDIEYQKYKGSKSVLKWRSWLPNWWWGFGYYKEKVFKHTLEFLSFFILVSFIFLKSLQNNIYSLAALKDAPQNIYSHIGKRLWYSIAYSTSIFLLLSLKIDNLKLQSKPIYILGTLYVVLMHAVGLCCLGYIANFILQK